MLVLVALVAAVATGTNYGACTSISADTERLACYDRAAGRSETTSSSAATISSALVAKLQALAPKFARHIPVVEIFSNRGDTRGNIFSQRGMIVTRTADALKSGGTWEPKASDLNDVVIIGCGYAEKLDEIFECGSARLLVNGSERKPISYKASTHVYTNAMSVRREVRQVTAAYGAQGLEKGFTVEYASPEGTSWTRVVSEEEASEKLLLDLEL